ncbi:MAG: BamA/TamA family outer membrane protein [Steroidobacteraceae bacterium]
MRGLLILLACGVLGMQCAHAADPQPYTIDWISSHDKSIDSTMKLTSQLETLRETAPTDPFGLIARARGDVNRLQTVLQSFGYYNGSVAIKINGMALDSEDLGEKLSALPKKSQAHVQIIPMLGPLFHVGHVTFKGELPSGFERKLPLATGAPAAAAAVLAAGATLQTALQDAGYAFARVDPPVAYERPAQKVLDLTFAVTAGARVRIGQIRIEGLRDVRESFVTRGLLLHKGEQYDAAAIEKAREGLLSLGLFSTVSIEMGKPDSAQSVPITFVVREAKKYTVGASAAYSSDLGGSTGFNWSDRNVFGSGQQLTASASAINLGGSASTGLGYDVTVGYSIPDFLQPDQTLGYSVGALRQALQAYTQTGETVGTSLTRKLSSVWTLTTGLSFEHEIIDQESAQYLYNLVMLPLSAAYDSTDLVSPLDDPTHGLRISTSITPTFSHGEGASGKLYTVVQASVTTYFDVDHLFAGDPPGRTVIAARALSGAALGATQFSLPPDQRFYAGGSGTVRGYRYQSVGPEFADGNPEGGTSMEAMNLELRQRVGTNLGFVTFVDGGGVSSPSGTVYRIGGTNYHVGGSVYRIGVGAGVRYYTSIGPIRFDLGLPTQRRPNDDRFEIYIGLGQAF